MRRPTSWLSWLAILLIAMAPAAMGLGLPAAGAGALPAAAHHAADVGHHGRQATAPDPAVPGPDAPSDHHRGATSCCAIGCAVAAVLDEQRVQGPAPRRLRALTASEFAAGRATSPPRRPPRLQA